MIDPVAWHKFLDHKSQLLIYINLWSIPNSFLTTKITMCSKVKARQCVWCIFNLSNRPTITHYESVLFTELVSVTSKWSNSNIDRS